MHPSMHPSPVLSPIAATGPDPLPETRSGALQRSKSGQPLVFRLTAAEAVAARRGRQIFVDVRTNDFFEVGMAEHGVDMSVLKGHAASMLI